MPLRIVINDITKVKADIIVNSANPRPIHGGGIDGAIYKAAGEQELLAARKAIGRIERGNIGVTEAFGLEAKYIIHAVGPRWQGGNEKELKVLETCYRKSLEEVEKRKLSSIAFPLIGTGKNGVPQELALSIALTVFCDWLAVESISIFVAVTSDRLFEMAQKKIAEFKSLIVNKDVNFETEIEYLTSREDELEKQKDELLSKYVQRKTFGDKLQELIAAKGMKNSDVYNKAGIDRKYFSNVCNRNKHRPSKKRVYLLSLALELDLEETKDLLARAEWASEPQKEMELIVQEAILNRKYDIFALNEELERKTGKILDDWKD